MTRSLPSVHRARLVAFGASLLVLPSTALAGEVTQPYPGVTVVRRPGEGAMVVIDLCAPGVSIRATRYEEREQTAGEWGSSLGLEVAQNGDFFQFPGWGYVIGRARGAGVDWPANAQQKENRPYWQFGPGLADGVLDGAAAPTPGVTEIVGGHNVIMLGGATTGPWADANDGQLLNNAYKRSAVGLSANRRTLYMLSTQATVSASTLNTWLQSFAAEAGASPVDLAFNMDGGGSSELYVKGLGQIVDSTRDVANHLGVAAKGVGPSPNCNNAPPIGYLDLATCDSLYGWAQDPTAPDTPIAVHLYFNGAAGDPNATSIPVTANVERDDLCMALGSCNHGFDLPPPNSLLDGQPHPVHAYAIDSEGGLNPQLSQSPAVLECMLALDGVRRHVIDPQSYTAWKFSAFYDRLDVDDDALAALDEALPFPAAPLLIRADDGSNEVWLVDGDGEVRRHVPNPAVAAMWRLDLSAVMIVPAVEVAALDEGPPLRERPLLIKGSGSAVYVLDEPLELPGDTSDDAGDESGDESSGDTSGTDGSSEESGDTGATTGSGLDRAGDEGCACEVRDDRKGPALGLLVLLGLGLRRRRGPCEGDHRA